MQKSFCLKCKKEVSENTKKCKCGGESFAFGDTLQVVENEIQCQCGSKAILRGSHMDFTNKYVNSGSCAACGSPIGIETYRDKESMMYWGEDEEYEAKSKYEKKVLNRQKLYKKLHGKK